MCREQTHVFSVGGPSTHVPPSGFLGSVVVGRGLGSVIGVLTNVFPARGSKHCSGHDSMIGLPFFAQLVKSVAGRGLGSIVV